MTHRSRAVHPAAVTALTLIITGAVDAQQHPPRVQPAIQADPSTVDFARTVSPQLDGELVAFALPLVERAAAIAAVWPGFWSESPRFMLLRDQKSALLVTPSAPPDEYRQVVDPALPSPLQGLLFLRAEYPAQLGPRSFSLRFAVGRDTVPALEPQGRSLFSRIDFYLHESFHGYQREHFTPRPEDARRVRMGEHLVDPAQLGEGFLPAVEHEQALLARALHAPAADRSRLVLEYIAARDERLANRPDAAAVELSMERMEGTATWLGCSATAAALGAPEGTGRACITEVLERAITGMPAGPEADAQLMRWRLYGTGAALAMLLDDLQYEGWQQRIKAGGALLELVREAAQSAAASRWQGSATR